MFDFLTPTDENDAIALLKKDHDTVKELFGEFMNTEELSARKRICAETLKELRIHAIIEEEIFYPALRTKLEKDIMNEADEEHHVAKLLIAELAQMSGTEDHFKSKYHVLSENIRHHIKEEEEKMFPKARDTDVDFVALGKQLLARKTQLKNGTIPMAAEDKLIARHGKNDDSPAQAAKKKVTAKKVAKKPVVAKLKTVARKLTKKAAPAKKSLLSKSKAATKLFTKKRPQAKAAVKKVIPFKAAAHAKKKAAGKAASQRAHRR